MAQARTYKCVHVPSYHQVTLTQAQRNEDFSLKSWLGSLGMGHYLQSLAGNFIGYMLSEVFFFSDCVDVLFEVIKFMALRKVNTSFH